MKNNKFFNSYFKLISKGLSAVDTDLLLKVANLIKETSDRSGKVIVIGNGGSAAIASHVSLDLIKAAGIRSINFNEASLLTCFSNDYGYDRWVEMALEHYADINDSVILISSSGQSKNIINGANKANKMRLPLITLTGFLSENPLKKIGNINLWVDSSNYNVVETTHQTWLLSIVDFITSRNINGAL